MLFEKIINFFDYFHQSRIINYLEKFEINHFIDVGSHKGEFLSYLLKLKHKKIYCFEAQKDIFKILSRKYKKNKKIELFNIGLADKKATKFFYFNIFYCLVCQKRFFHWCGFHGFQSILNL